MTYQVGWSVVWRKFVKLQKLIINQVPHVMHLNPDTNCTVQVRIIAVPIGAKKLNSQNKINLHFLTQPQTLASCELILFEAFDQSHFDVTNFKSYFAIEQFHFERYFELSEAAYSLTQSFLPIWVLNYDKISIQHSVAKN